MTNYANGKIYKIWSPSTGLTYIGSTTQPLSKRMGEHRRHQHKTTSKQVFECGDARIDLIETCSCTCKEELRKKEGQLIQEMECVNKRIAGRTRKEWIDQNRDSYLQKKKDYYEENKQEISNVRRQKYQQNRDEILKKNREYNKKNQKEIYAKRRGYIRAWEKRMVVCECGCEISRKSLPRHQKSKKHKNILEKKQTEQS